MDTSDQERQSLLRQLAMYQQNLNTLNEQAAQFGRIHEPISLTNQIDETRTRIHEIKTTLASLGEPDRLGSATVLRKEKGMPMKRTSSPWFWFGGLIMLVVVIGGTFWIWNRSQASFLEYSGIVRDAQTNQPLAHAKVTLELPTTTHVLYTDSEGFYRFKIGDTDLPIQGVTNVELAIYEPYRRNTLLVETQLQLDDIRLKKPPIDPVSSIPTPSIPPPVSPTPESEPASDGQGSDALAISSRIQCNFATKCYQLKPDQWEPLLPATARGSAANPKDVASLMSQYGADTFVFFPWGTPIPPEVAPAPTASPTYYACIPGSSVYIEVSVHNTGTRQMIIERDPVLKLTGYESFSGPVHAFLYKPEGGVLIRTYAALIQPVPIGEQLGVTAVNEAATFGAYTLQPDEIEIFHVYLDCAAPGKYLVQVGIKVQNAQDIVWDFDGINISSPAAYYDWVYGIESNGYSGVLDGLKQYNQQSGAWDRVEKKTIDQWVSE